MKYMGSNARYAKEILPIILKDRKPEQWYIEPFAGGMNLIDKVEGNRIANDINYELIQMWEALVNDDWLPNKHISREVYNKIRTDKANYEPWLVGWVGFNCSYSGKYFGGYAGQVKTKDGTIRDYQAEAHKNTKKQIPNLKGVVFTNKEYWDLQIPPNSIIYCDPPYQNTTKYSTDFDHNLFWEWVRNMSKQGHSVWVSEYNAPYDFECVWEKKARSSLSANGKIGGSKISTEKLFMYCG
jgi:DNA adenine methylase